MRLLRSSFLLAATFLAMGSPISNAAVVGADVTIDSDTVITGSDWTALVFPRMPRSR